VQGKGLLLFQAQKRVRLDFNSSENCGWELTGISQIKIGSIYGYKFIAIHTTRLLLIQDVIFLSYFCLKQVISINHLFLFKTFKKKKKIQKIWIIFCRNYFLKKTTGDYLIRFDSHQRKFKTFLKSLCTFLHDYNMCN